MIMHKQKIAMVIYANPDYYPPLINAIQILTKEFDLVVICRNQDRQDMDYPKNVKIYRLGRLNTSREKEAQSLIKKILEYTLFVLRTIFYMRTYRCRLIYSYDMHGFIAGFFACRLGKRIPLIYHNFDLSELKETKGLTYAIKYLELRLARYADKVVFCDINRARFFQQETKLTKLLDVVINAPLVIGQLPANKLIQILIQKGASADLKIVLYRGMIGEGHYILETVRSMVLWPNNTAFVLMGYIYRNDFLENIYDTARVLGVEGRIHYLGFFPYSRCSNYSIGASLGLALYKPVSKNSIFISGASNKIYEYISLGIPVITNDSPYFREVLDSSFAYFAKYDSVEDIARAINLVFSDKEEYIRKCQAARQAHLTKFNYEVQFQPILEYIKTI